MKSIPRVRQPDRGASNHERTTSWAVKDHGSASESQTLSSKVPLERSAQGVVHALESPVNGAANIPIRPRDPLSAVNSETALGDHDSAIMGNARVAVCPFRVDQDALDAPDSTPGSGNPGQVSRDSCRLQERHASLSGQWAQHHPAWTPASCSIPTCNMQRGARVRFGTRADTVQAAVFF